MSSDLVNQSGGYEDRSTAVDYRQDPHVLTQRWHYIEPAPRSRAGWWVACVLFVICAAQAAAIALLLPLKEVVPYTILVDRQTGYAETVRGVDIGALAEDEAITQSFLAQYVLNRETYDAVDLAERYERVALWSDGEARASYVDSYRSDNPSSLPLIFPSGATVEITIKSVEILTLNSARVRFETRTTIPGRDAERADYQAVMSFRYKNAAMRMEDRLVNPLGFQVLTYRRDAETISPVPAEPEPAPASRQVPDEPAATPEPPTEELQP
jgi:type IV secretion system protein VirB8